MFRHQGKTRTFGHNVRIATVLSFVAGIVNATGFLSIQQLTTNVTGHFAFFINDLARSDFWQGAVYLLYIFSFLVGSFVSSVLIETFRENKKLNVFVVPTMVEILILSSVPLYNSYAAASNPNIIACVLLFAMGLQNSYVTRISNAVVRTTHLTGLFTDLGIELSQLFFRKSHPHHGKIMSTITLRVFIICFFFLGGLAGGYLYIRTSLELNTLYIAASILLLSLLYDDFRYQVILARRKLKKRKGR